MPDKAVTDEKSYHEWLTEALEKDEQTWAALEAKLKTRRVRLAPPEEKEPPRDC